MRTLLLCACACALMLSACGGGGDSAADTGVNTGVDTGVNPSPPPPVSAADSFFAAVLAFVGSDADGSEPAALDSVAATSPDDAEPRPVP